MKVKADPVQVGVLGAHQDEILALTIGESVPLAHHQRHVVEFVDFKRVKDEVDELLIHVVHLDDEVSLVNGVACSLRAGLV